MKKWMSLLSDNRELIESILQEIKLQLQNRETFSRAIAQDRFSEITIGGILTVVPSYIYTGIDIKEEDLKYPKKIVDDFVKEWCSCDDDKSIRYFQQFIKDGQRWGWD